MNKKSQMVQNGYKKNPLKFSCELCLYNTGNKKDFIKHTLTKKHDTKWVHVRKNNNCYFSCDNCHYITCDLDDFNHHLNTFSHTNLSLVEGTNFISTTNMKEKKYECEFCNKKYKFSSGYYRHIKNCKKKTTINNDNKLVEMLVKTAENNNKLCEKLIELEQNQKIIQNNISNQTINNEVNINVFLNSECKNAMNLTDFVDNIRLSLEDLVYTKDNGYIKGITNIFVKKLEELNPSERPIHSVLDKKKKQFYIKDENIWECDNEEKQIDKSIDSVTKKQINKIKEWESVNPNWNETEMGIEEYMKMIQTIMGGSNETERLQNKKLIKKELTENTDIEKTVLVLKN